MTKKTTEHDNFGNLLSKLVQVPNEEVDAEEAKWKSMRKRLKAKGQESENPEAEVRAGVTPSTSRTMLRNKIGGPFTDADPA